jgi:predicted transcriptional regulator YdeE
MAKVMIDAVETLPNKTLVGYCSIIDSRRVGQVYETLWANFLDRLAFTAIPSGRDLYGVCANLNSQSGFFEYWTAVEVRLGEPAPWDLVEIPLDAGTYGLRIERPDNTLPKVYGELVHGLEAPSDYILNWRRPFFEVYQPDWPNRRAVKMAFPLNAVLMTAELRVSARAAGVGQMSWEAAGI